MRTILSISQNDVLLLSRAAVLRTTDAEVIAARANDAKKILKTRRFDLVVCHSLSPEQTVEIASLAHEQTVAIPVLKVVTSSEPVSEWTQIADAAASCDPRVLVEKVAKLLNLSPLGIQLETRTPVVLRSGEAPTGGAPCGSAAFLRGLARG